MFRAAWKSLLGRKLRLLMSTFAIVLGVAFVAGSFVFTDTLSRSFTAIFAFQWIYWHALLPGRPLPGIHPAMPTRGKRHTVLTSEGG